MKRFFAVIFVILMLCQDVSASQTKTNTSRESNPPPPIAKEQNPADKSPAPHQKKADIPDSNIVRDQDPPIVERVKQLATKTNWALFFSFLATVFTGLSWVVAKNGVKVTREAAKAEFQPCIKITNIKTCVTGVSRKDKSALWTSFNITVVHFFLENIGKTPLHDLIVSGIFTVEDKSAKIKVSNIPKGMISEGIPLDLFIDCTFDFPNGGAELFNPDEINLNLQIRFKDMFSGKNQRMIKVHMRRNSGMQFGLRVESVEEIKQD